MGPLKIDESTLGLLVFLLLSITASVVAHLRTTNFAKAVFISAGVTTIAFHLASCIASGKAENFMGFTIPIVGIASMVPSVLIGAFIKLLRSFRSQPPTP